MTKVSDIYNYMDSIAPYSEAEQWDNSGFIIGDFEREVTAVVMALDATRQSIEYASSVGAQLLLTHHPVIFNSIKRVEKNSPVFLLIKSDICAMCAHTSFDKASGGINDNLAKILGLSNTKTLESGYLVAGDLPGEMSIDDFAAFVSDTLGTRGLRYTLSDRIIKRVAVGGGACGEFLDEAMQNSDCFLTGELKYHEMLFAAENNFATINAGHFETENAPFLMLKAELEKQFKDVEFLVAPVKNPVEEL